jgi:hypothetical protein
MLSFQKPNLLFALSTLKEKELAHQAFSLEPFSVGRAFCFGDDKWEDRNLVGRNIN